MDMSYEAKKALEEIMEIPPIYRRDFMIDYVRQYLPRGVGKRLLFLKDKEGFLDRLIADGYVDKDEILERIGSDKIRQYLKQIGRES